MCKLEYKNFLPVHASTATSLIEVLSSKVSTVITTIISTETSLILVKLLVSGWLSSAEHSIIIVGIVIHVAHVVLGSAIEVLSTHVVVVIIVIIVVVVAELLLWTCRLKLNF
jgi:hypothetical protein